MNSNEARKNWRTMLDRVFQGKVSFVIERYSKPLAILVNFDEYERLRGARIDRVNEINRRVMDGEYFTLDEVRDGLGS